MFLSQVVPESTDKASYCLLEFDGVKVKNYFFVLLMFVTFMGACRKAGFKSVDKSLSIQQKADIGDTGGGDSDPSGDGTGDGDGGDGKMEDPAAEADNGLIVSVPVKEIMVGSASTQATAELKDGTKKPPVTWTVTAAAGKDPGMIDMNGVYTSPASGTEKYPVVITATLKSDPKVKDSVAINVIPAAMKPELIVSVPVNSIKVGGGMTQAIAKLKDGTPNPPVSWTVSGPSGKDIGRIEPTTGVYTSPHEGKETFAVIITATLLADKSVMGTTSLNIIPADTTVEIEDLKTACKTKAALLKETTQKIIFNERKDCSWNMGENRGRLEGGVQASETSEEVLNLPAGKICDLSIESPKNQTLHYDDLLILAIDKQIIFVSNVILTTYLQQKNGVFIWNFKDVVTKVFKIFDGTPYCIGDATECAFPTTDKQGPVTLNLPSSKIAPIALHVEGRTEVPVTLTATGDNEDEDCYHSRLDLTFKIKYLP